MAGKNDALKIGSTMYRQSTREDTSNFLILIAEDESEIASILDAYLVREGLRTVHARDGAVALELYKTLKPDLILLDVKMPNVDGWSVLSQIRTHSHTPIIMLTALDQDIDKLMALRVGADDYVVKPFNPAEVAARVRAVLRRTNKNVQAEILRIGALHIDLQSHVAYVTRQEEKILLALTLTEFRFLAHMARAPMRVFSRSELIDACLSESDPLDRTVDSHVSNLRKKLGQVGAAHLLMGIRGVGYRLDAASQQQ